jgi:hypothetical protein
VNHFSLSSLHLSIRVDENEVATATGFVYNFDSKSYLVTNWHNVSNQNPFNGEQLAERAYRANNFLISLYLKNGETKEEVIINLYEKGGETDIPKWYIHPEFEKKKIDVIAIELEGEIIKKYLIHHVNYDEFNQDIPPIISTAVFIIGYPFSDKKFRKGPVWKRGSIASDPDTN